MPKEIEEMLIPLDDLRKIIRTNDKKTLEVLVEAYGPNGTGEGEMLTVAIRAKEPDGDTSKLYEYPVSTSLLKDELTDNMKFAAAVAETGMLLRDSEWKGSATWDSALALLRSCGAVSGDVYKEEFVYLVGLLSR